MRLTLNQEKAIQHKGKTLQIIACAGSGKTRVLVEKICTILQTETSTKPENIIAFTFTEKAAAELKNRIDKSVKDKSISTLGMADMYVGTIHGYCLDFLQQQCMKYQKYSILNPIQTKLFVQKYDKEHLQVDIPTIGNANSSIHLPSHTAEYLSGISMIREEGLETHSELPQVWKDAFNRYNDLFYQFCYFDFSMIIDIAVKELQTPLAKEYIQNNIKYLIVDEYQDLNPIQEKLLSIFYEYGVNICVVGDDDQTIYQWRGSNTENFITFEDRYNIGEKDKIFLDTNFRSTSKIIDIAADIIVANQSRVKKEFKSGNQELSYQKNHDLFFREFSNHNDEAEFIADEISKLLDGGMQPSEIAILTRKKVINKPLLDALITKNIPVIVEGVEELFDQPVIQASKDIFQYIYGKIDRDILRYQWEEAIPLLDENNIENAIDNLDIIITKIPTKKSPLNFQLIFREFLSIVGIPQLTETQDTETLLYNLGQFSVLLSDFEKIHFNTYPSKSKLYYFETFIKYLADGNYSEGELLNMYTKPNAVQIMTIHKSKGLEFGAVFVPGMSKNSFPPKGKGGRGIQHYLDIKNLVDGGERYLKGEIDDERRLFYVAITRSKKFLFLTRANTYLGTSGEPNLRDYKNRSQFLQETFDIMDSPFVQTTPDIYTIPEEFKKEKSDANTVVNFSLLSGYIDCPYRFKIDNFYQFQEAISEYLGYGKSMHDMIKEMHIEGAKGKVYTYEDLPDIVDRHFHMPYAKSAVIDRSKQDCLTSLKSYIDKFGATFKDIEFVEQKIEVPLTESLLVTGRIDLIKNRDGTVDIIDFKTNDDIPNTKEQTMIYAIGYEQLTGRKPDMYKIYNIDENKVVTQDAILVKDMEKMKNFIIDAVENIKNNHLPKCTDKSKCKDCHKKDLCSGVN